MPRIGKSTVYTKKKKEALQNLNKIELKEKLENKTSELKEVTDNMRIEMDNTRVHNPKELHNNRRYQDLKIIRN